MHRQLQYKDKQNTFSIQWTKSFHMSGVPGTIGKLFLMEKRGEYWKIWALFFFCIMIAVILDILGTSGILPAFDFIFIIKLFFSLLAILFFGIYLQKRAREVPQPSQESYNSLLKACLAIILIDIGFIAACFFLASMFFRDQAAYFLVAIWVVVLISLWYFKKKNKELGFNFRL